MFAQKRKTYYRLYIGRFYDFDGSYSEWEVYEVQTTLDKAWKALRRVQANAFHPALVPLRICSVFDPEGSEDFDPYEDGGDETFIDEKGCGLAEWTRLHVTGEID
jgi:hypothetical protein